jgi:hypothetical protein
LLVGSTPSQPVGGAPIEMVTPGTVFAEINAAGLA